MSQRRMAFIDGLALASRAGDKTVTRRIGKREPCAVGDVIAVCESLVPKSGIGPWGRGTVDYVRYRSDGTFAWKEQNATIWPWNVRALPARYCPAWAVRTFLRVVDVRREPLDRIDDADAQREGIRYLGLPETREVFLSKFQAIHRDITPDTLVWRIQFERDIDASFMAIFRGKHRDNAMFPDPPPDPPPDVLEGYGHYMREAFERDMRARFPVVNPRGAA